MTQHKAEKTVERYQFDQEFEKYLRIASQRFLERLQRAATKRVIAFANENDAAEAEAALEENDAADAIEAIHILQRYTTKNKLLDYSRRGI